MLALAGWDSCLCKHIMFSHVGFDFVLCWNLATGISAYRIAASASLLPGDMSI